VLELRTVQSMYKPKRERNKQMKKITCAIMALLMVLSMAACAASDAGQETAKPTEGTAATKPSTGSTTPATKPTTESTSAPTEATKEFEKQVLVDNDRITVTVTGVKMDPIWGYTLQVFLENKTDKNLMFSLADVSVNGFMVDPLWAESVAPGKMSNTEIHFSEKSFKDNGIETVEELEFVLRVYNEKDFTDEDIHNQKHELKMQ